MSTKAFSGRHCHLHGPSQRSHRTQYKGSNIVVRSRDDEKPANCTLSNSNPPGLEIMVMQFWDYCLIESRGEIDLEPGPSS